jgi:malonate transporter
LLLELSSKKDAAKITALPLLRGIARSFRQPVVWSPILALLFVFCGLHLPPYGVATVRTLGNAANGSALLLTGVVISIGRSDCLLLRKKMDYYRAQFGIQPHDGSQIFIA